MARLRPAILAATLSLAVWLSGAARAADVAFTAHVLPDFAIGHPERTQFGKLEWIGGFEIEADNRDAGGFSGLVVSDHGQHLRRDLFTRLRPVQPRKAPGRGGGTLGE